MSDPIKLYEIPVSGNCYKIRLFMSVLGLEYTRIPVDMKAGENMRDEYRAMNPNGQVPVIVDGEQTIYDSAAILVYLAKTYGGEQWLPLEPIALANVIRWLAFEQSEGRFGLARARAIARNMPTPMARLGTLEESQILGNNALDMLEHQLAQTPWLAGDVPTIADIACYPYTALSVEGGLSPLDRPAVSRWMQAIEAMDAWIPLPGAD